MSMSKFKLSIYCQLLDQETDALYHLNGNGRRLSKDRNKVKEKTNLCYILDARSLIPRIPRHVYFGATQPISYLHTICTAVKRPTLAQLPPKFSKGLNCGNF